MLQEEYETAAVKQDLSRNSSIKCGLPVIHISNMVAKQFASQSWMRITEDDLKTDFQTLGAAFKSPQLAGKVRRNMVVFPSIEGVIHLMIKKGWMTREEAAVEDPQDQA